MESCGKRKAVALAISSVHPGHPNVWPAAGGGDGDLLAATHLDLLRGV